MYQKYCAFLLRWFYLNISVCACCNQWPAKFWPRRFFLCCWCIFVPSASAVSEHFASTFQDELSVFCLAFLGWSDVHAWHRWQFAIWIVRLPCCHTHTWGQGCRLWTWRVMLTIRPCSGHSQRYTFVWYLHWLVIFRSNRSTAIAVCENSVWHTICGTKFWIDAMSVKKAAIIVLWLTSWSQKCQVNWLENRWSIWALQSRSYIQMRCIHSAGEYLHWPVGQICKGQWKDVIDVWVPRPIFSKLLYFCEGRKACLVTVTDCLNKTGVEVYIYSMWTQSASLSDLWLCPIRCSDAALKKQLPSAATGTLFRPLWSSSESSLLLCNRAARRRRLLILWLFATAEDKSSSLLSPATHNTLSVS